MSDGHSGPPPSAEASRIITDGRMTQRVVNEALHHLWAVVNSLSSVQPADQHAFSVAVFGSARIKPEHQLYDRVKWLTTQLSSLGCDIVTGGGPGLMQAANEGAQAGDPEDNARSIGVGVSLPFETGANPFVELAFTHETFFTRLHQFVRLSHAFVVVGGGIGTTLEALMVWQLLQVRHLKDTPMIMVGPMWRGLVDWARASMLSHEPPFASARDMDVPLCVDTVEEAMALLRPRIEAFKASQTD